MPTVHYPNGKTFIYHEAWAILYNLNYRFYSNSGLFGYSGMPSTSQGYFQVIEFSGDKEDIWVEFFDE